MTAFVFSALAEFDVLSIWSYIAESDGMMRADFILDEIVRLCERVARSPGIGHSRADLTALPVRFFAVHSYLVIYEPQSKPLIIHSVLHGARDIASVLKGRTKP